MQQDNNNMDKKLKQLENQSLPDLSKMDEHWQGLKDSLHPTDSLSKSRSNRKIYRWIVASSLAAIAFFITYQFVFKKKDEKVVLHTWNRISTSQPPTDTNPTLKFVPGKETFTVIGKDTIKLTPQKENIEADTIFLTGTTTDGRPVKLLATHVSSKKNRDTLYFIPQKEENKTIPFSVQRTGDKKDFDTVEAIIKPNSSGRRRATVSLKPQTEKTSRDTVILKANTTDGIGIDLIVVPVIDTANKKRPVNNKKALDDFFAQLEKESQTFVINNDRDTVIRGNEGTEIYISANSFYPYKNVTISLKEFYSYQDIITNKLITTSGGKLLITGGMLNIKAFSDNKELSSVQKEILIKMPANKLDDEMQLFVSQSNYFQITSSSAVIENLNFDTVAFSNTINWIPAGQSQRIQRTLPMIRTLNLLDYHHTISYDKYTTASYFIANSCPLSNEQVKFELEKRYGFNYGRIKVKRLWGNRKRTFPFGNAEFPVVGDSLSVAFETALKYKLISKEDSVNYVRNLKAEDSIYFARISNIEKKYNFRITNLGWINCDKFYDDYRPKVDFVVNLGVDASNYYTVIVFEKMKSMMNGYVSGNKVIFSNVPDGEPVRIISVSIKNDNTISAMQSVQISRKPLEGLKFEGTTPTDFKEKAGTLDKP